MENRCLYIINLARCKLEGGHSGYCSYHITLIFNDIKIQNNLYIPNRKGSDFPAWTFHGINGTKLNLLPAERREFHWSSSLKSKLFEIDPKISG